MEKKYVSYPVNFSHEAVSQVLDVLETASMGIDRDLLITALITFVIGLSDPSVLEDDYKFQSVLENISSHICWALESATQKLEPKDYN